VGVKISHKPHTFVASSIKQALKKDIGKQMTAVETVTKGTSPCLNSRLVG